MFDGCYLLIDLLFKIIENKGEYKEKACMLNALQKLCDHRQVIEYIKEKNYGHKIVNYLDKLTSEEDCC